MRAKLVLFLMAAVFVSETVLAQPSQAVMLEKVKSEFNVDLISHKLIGPGGIDREYINAVPTDIFTQPFEVVQKSDFPEYPTRYKASLRYIKSGNEWIFQQFTIGSASYLNVPAPDKTFIINLLKSNIGQWIDKSFVGEVENIRLADDPDWYNKTPNDVAFFAWATYSTKYSKTQLEKADHFYRITLKRENLKSEWKIVWGIEQTDKKKVIAKTNHTQQEIENMKTYDQMVEQNEAQAAMDALPKVPEAPVFQSDKQLFYYIHNKILTSSPQEIEAHLMKLVDQSCYEDGSKLFFKAYHADWINNLVANADKYKKAYCEYPGVKAEQYGQIEFLNRSFSNYVTFTGKPVDGTWKLVDFRFVPDNDAALAKMVGDDSKCQPKPDLAVKEVLRYKVGDKVIVQFSNGSRPCTIDKTDPNFADRYFVKIDDDTSGKGYWINDTYITPNDGNNNDGAGKKPNPEKTFKVGDKVEINTSAGWLKGEIVQILGTKYQVKFDDSSYKNMWIGKDNLR